MTDWFRSDAGVRQGDTLSPTLFSLYINDLAVAIKGLNIGVKLGNELVSILLYADDMVLLSESEADICKPFSIQLTYGVNAGESK